MKARSSTSSPPFRSALAGAQRVVIKVGTSVVTHSQDPGAGGRLALGRLGLLVEAIGRLRARGVQVVLVSSGAVGLGAERLGLSRAPSGVVERQACAAAGQSALMGLYDNLFARVGLHCAQVLLTASDFDDRARYVHLAATLQRLLSLGVVPVVNENDVVSIAEIAEHGPRVFGDNDRLSALVASGLAADALLLLSDVAAVFNAPPGTAGARPLAQLQVAPHGGDAGVLDESGQPVELGGPSAGGRGGMFAKVGAACMGARAGVQVVIASGHLEQGHPASDARGPAAGQTVIDRILAGHPEGTWLPAAARPGSRKRWLAFATEPEGTLTLDGGAVNAVRHHTASLLAPGVTGVLGDWAAGAVVRLVDGVGTEVGRGRAAVSAEALRAGGPVGDRGLVVVHRDHLVLFGTTPTPSEEAAP